MGQGMKRGLPLTRWPEIGAPKPGGPGRALRSGFSTGTAAAAAAQGAFYELLGLPCPEQVEVALPGGGRLTIPLTRHGRAGSRGEAVVVKDAGDDPDVTHGAEIGVRLGWAPGPGTGELLEMVGGYGVGRVTKPGLPVAVGEPAINPVPRRMLRQAVTGVWEAHGLGRPPRLRLEVFVPLGEELARHTLNPRLGIVGGISILGTTGLVRPYSHAAWRATIVAALKVARAQGWRQVVFATGGSSEAALMRLLPELPPGCFVLMGDYVRFSLRAAAHLGFRQVTVGAFVGKAVKMAQGLGQTHASRGLIDFAALGRWVGRVTGDPFLARETARANTARQVWGLLPPTAREAMAAEVGRRLLAALRRHVGPAVHLTAIILDFDGRPQWRGEGEG